MFVEIGALVEKEIGLNAYHEIHNKEGVEYIFAETGRSNDLFDDKQFGQFGESAILTLIVKKDQKDTVMEELHKLCGLNESSQGIVFSEKTLVKSSQR